MAIAKIIFRKMLNNRWLVGSLFLGLLITSSLVASIPTYSASVLSKLLIKELENYQIKENHYPGEYSFYLDTQKDPSINQNKFVEELDRMNDRLTQDTGLPLKTKVTVISTIPISVSKQEGDQSTSKSQKYGSIKSLTELQKHMVLTDGRLPNSSVKDGVYEVLVTEMALQKRDMVLNKVLLAGEGKKQIKIKPVGTFKAKDERDPYWFLSPDSYSNDFILPEKTFRDSFLKGNDKWIENIRYFTAFDYHAINMEKFNVLLALEAKTKASISEISNAKVFVNFPIKEILVTYNEKSSQLKTMLWSLNVPILIMVGIYLFMVTRLIIERQRNEIAVLNSRGAKKSQILLIYLLEISSLSLIAFLLGPFIGLFLCKMLGATNGFLQFVQRSPLELRIMKEAFLYEIWAICACILMMMIPIYQAASKSIVHHKQTMTRISGNAGWYTIFIDLALLGLSLYGWKSFSRRQQDLMTFSDGGSNFSVDPLLFFVPTAFIIGSGLLLLRLYPILLKSLFILGKRFWPLSLYSTLVQVSRASKQYLYLMLFLILTIAVGVYSASAARTINSNLEEQLRYENGADLAVNVLWPSVNPGSSQAQQYGPNATESKKDSKEEEVEASSTPIYSEPPFDPFLKLKDIEHATKVFRKKDVFAHAKGEDIPAVELMGIEPKDFGQTAWFKTTLLEHHWYQYLNLLAKEPSAVLISNEVAEKLGVKTGDYLTLNWNGSDTVEFVVYGIVKYWPSFNPAKVNESEAGNTAPALVVANLTYVQTFMGLEPYEVWLKTKPNSTRASLYEDMKKQGIPLTSVQDVQPKLNELKNGAFLLGINGSLSLGFVISIMITFIGFLIYWILTMKSRILQYGIYRAMGIPLKQLIGILFYEQLLTSGVACVIGIGIGSITSTLFVPLFQLSFNSANAAPPFQVIFDPSDELRIYSLVILILTIGLTILGVLLKNIRVHQAIKLGED